MPGTLQPLDRYYAIVDDQGRPTEYFIRWAQQKQRDITDSASLADLLTRVPYIDGNGDGTVPNPGAWVLGEWRIRPAGPDPTKGSILVEGPYNQAALMGAQFQLDASSQSSDVGVVWGSNTNWSHWYGLGALSPNNRYYLYGDRAFEFSVTPFVGVNKIFNAGNLIFGTNLTYNAGTGVLDAAGGGGGGGSLLCPYPSSGIDPATSSGVATSPAMLMIGGFTGASTTVKGIWLPCRSVAGRVCVPALYDAGLITAGTPPTPTGAALVATGPSVAMVDNKIMYMPFTAPFATVANHYYFLSVIYSGAAGSITTMALGSNRRGWYNLSGVTVAPNPAPAMTNHISDFYGFWND